MTKDTGKAKLPGLVAPRVDNPDLARWVQAVAERLEVREGARGNPYERAVTVRDLTEGGIAVLGGGGRLAGPGGSGGGGYGPGSNPDYDLFWENLKNSNLYRELMKRLNDQTRFDDMAEEARAVLLRDIAEEARLRGADIQRMELKIQTETRSLAMAVQEVTAAVQDAAAGVRFTQVAQADATNALAANITQVQAKFGERVAGVEQVIKATAGVDGSEASYYVKVDVNKAYGAFGLSAVAPADPSKPAYSQFLIAADKFAVISPDGKLNPFGIDSTGIYLNGKVRINANGTAVEDLANGIELSASGQVFNVDNKGAITPSAVTVTAKPTGKLAARPVSFTTTPAGVGSQSGNTYTVPSSAFGAGATVKVTATATTADGKLSYSDDFTLYKVVDGADALVGFLTNESHGLPANELGVVSSYAGASGEMVLFKGGKRQTTGVTFSVAANPNGLNVNIGATTGAYSVTSGLAVDTATVTFRAAFAGATLDKVFTLTRQKDGKQGDIGKDGVRGSITAYGTAEFWSDSTAQALILAIAKTGGLRIGDTVTLSNSAKTWSRTKYWGGTAWLDPGVIIDGNLLVNGTVSSDKIAANSIKADRLDANVFSAIKVSASQITTNTVGGTNGITFGFGLDTYAAVPGGVSYPGAGFFQTMTPGTFGLAALHQGGGNAFAAGTFGSAPSGSAAIFSGGGNGGTSSHTLARICGTDMANGLTGTGREETAGSFVHVGNSNYAYLGQASRAAWFKNGSNIQTTICEGGYGLSTNGAINCASLTVNGAAVTGGGGGDDVDISPKKVSASDVVTCTANGMTTKLCGPGYIGNSYYYWGLHTGASIGASGNIVAGADVMAVGNVYAKGKVLTFTGAHFALLAKNAPVVEGDIVLDDSVVSRGGISEVITGVVQSRAPNQKGALGVYSGDDGTVPSSMAAEAGGVDPQYAPLLQTHKVITVNSLGEGQINLCGEGGDLEIGDLIVTSSMPGKGMRQMKDGEVDDLVRSYTVAKVREPVRFSSPTEVKMAACIYLCG